MRVVPALGEFKPRVSDVGGPSGGIGSAQRVRRTREHWTGPQKRLGGRPSARAVEQADGVWGASEQRSARSARAADGPPGLFDGLAASLYGWAVDSLAMALATVGGVGRVPVASGTFGSLAAVPLLPALAALRAGSLAGYVAVVLGIVAVAVWSAGRPEHVLESRDHSHIVID